MLRPLRERFNRLFGLDADSLGHKILKGIVTFAMVNFMWVFFRADSVGDAVRIVRGMFMAQNPQALVDGSLYELGLDRGNFGLLIISITILMLADLAKYKGIVIRDVILRQELWCRWFCYLTAIVFILVFGIWGTNYDAAGFIYFQF